MTRQSESVGALMGALARAQGSMRAAKKDRVNPHLGNKYATLDAVWDACREHLAANELALVQMFSTDKPGVLTCDTMLGHSSGEWLSTSFEYPISTEQRGVSPVQQLGSLMTYIKRYTMSGVVGVTVDEDTDGNDDKPAGNGNGNGGKRQAAPATPPAQAATPAAGKCQGCGAPNGKPHASNCKWGGNGSTATATRTAEEAAVEAHAPLSAEEQAKREKSGAWTEMVVSPGFTAPAKDHAAVLDLVHRVIGVRCADVRELTVEHMRAVKGELCARDQAKRRFYVVAGKAASDNEDRTRLSSLLGRNIESRRDLDAAAWNHAADLLDGQANDAPLPVEPAEDPDPFADA